MKNNYYIYFHIRSRDNVVFYVGKGNYRTNRAKRKERSQRWKNFIGNENYLIQIVPCGSEELALLAERLLINNPHPLWNLVNVAKDNRIKKIPHEIGEYVEYSETSPSCLRWKVDVGYKIKKGGVTGSQNKLGYWNFEVNGKSYANHRVIYFLHKEDPGSNVINHIDTHPWNNRISNLEAISIAENNRRSKPQLGTPQRNNKTGVNGVSPRDNGERLSATVYIDGRKINKTYSVVKLGYEKAMEMCKSWLEEQRQLTCLGKRSYDTNN